MVSIVPLGAIDAVDRILCVILISFYMMYNEF